MTHLSLETRTFVRPVTVNCVMVVLSFRVSDLLFMDISGSEKGSKGGILSLEMPEKYNNAIKPYFRIMKY